MLSRPSLILLTSLTRDVLSCARTLSAIVALCSIATCGAAVASANVALFVQEQTATESTSDAASASDSTRGPDSELAPATESGSSTERPPRPEATPALSTTSVQTGANPTPLLSSPAESPLDPAAQTEMQAAEDSGSPAANTAAPAPTDGPRRAESLDPEWLDTQTKVLLGVVLVTLGIASLVGQYLRRQPTESVNPALVQRFRQRLHAWWLMCAILVFGLLLQPTGTIVLFALVSFWALREFITMAPTRRGDHRALFWAMIVITPLQYILIGLEHGGLRWRNGQPIDFYGLYSIMIPVYASLLVPARIALSGDHKRFLERSAQITIGLLICVYSLSYAAALVNLHLATSSGASWTGSPAGLLFFFILISQLSDILQWAWGHLVGKRVIAADVSSSRTWEGFTGGTLSIGLIGGALYWVTPFSFWEASCMSMVIGVMGMFGGMTMSAIKRDRGVNDYGSLVMGHAGVLDRIDTLCFAAPVFYHLTRFFFSN